MYVDLCGPVFVFKAVCGVIHSLCCACIAPYQFDCTAKREESPESFYCIAAVKEQKKNVCYNQSILLCATFFRHQQGFLISVCVIVCFH